MSHIYVIGYYDHFNVGDEQYKFTIKKVLEPVIGGDSVDFLDIDKVRTVKFKDSDIIILGGGDVLNNYFLDKLPNGIRIIAASVGIPYTSIITNGKLSQISHVFVRNYFDRTILRKYSNIRSTYVPDFSCMLMTIPMDDYVSETYNKLSGIRKKIVCMMLSRSIYNSGGGGSGGGYQSIIDSLIVFILFLVRNNYHVVLLPFDTNPDKTKTKNDTLINNDVDLHLDSITNVKETLNHLQIYKLFELFNIAISMKYHGCLYAMYNNVPFIPVYTTNKISKLMEDRPGIEHYKLPTDGSDFPTGLDETILIDKFRKVVTNYCTYYNNLVHINKTILTYELPNIHKFQKTVQTVLNSPKVIIPANLSITQIIYNKLSEYSENPLEETNPMKQQIIVQLASYYLTNSLNSIYSHGLQQKMFNQNYNYKAEWSWVINDHVQKKLSEECENEVEESLFNLSYIDQSDHSGVHRSGWQYVYNQIKKFDDNSKIMLDLYVDKTFHWNKDALKHLNIIPYTKPWIGFIHHTFESEFSEYNCHNLFKDPCFLESLINCKCLIVLSKYLKNLIEPFTTVPVYVLYHPTEQVDSKMHFSLQKFYKNEIKKIIHIGGWMRNIYSFYELPPITLTKPNCFKPITEQLHKYAIVGKHMSNYFPDENFIRDIETCITQIPNSNQPPIPSCSCETLTNNFYKQFLARIKENIDSVRLINFIDDNEYDKLLSENIVFVNLIDASAVNTVIECVMRNTPIYINKHPAVVEILGEKYPLYHPTNPTTNPKTNNHTTLLTLKHIEDAHKYLKNMSKTELYIQTFIKKLKCIVMRI